ncbi:MAG: rhodanese-like domain-containing protein [Actinomycetota bacterium]|nr:rhodanese-like domain-containing protein [Actinomycetota bacterium]
MSRLTTDDAATRSGLRAEIRPNGQARFLTGVPQPDPAPPPPVFEPPPIGTGSGQLLQSAGQLATTLSGFAGMFSSPAVMRLLGSPEVKQLLGSPELQRLRGSAEVKQLLANPDIQRLLGHPVLKQVLGNLTGRSQQQLAPGGGSPSGGAPAAVGGTFTAQPSDDAPPPSPVFDMPSTAGASLQQLLAGVEHLLPAASAVVGMLPADAIKRLLGVLMGVAQRGAGAGAGSLSVLGGLAGPSVYDATLSEPGQSTREVSTNELRRILAEHSALVFDNRTPLEYAIGHIPGALNVSPKPGVAMSLYVGDVAEIAQIAPSRQAPIVVYCNGPFCGKSRRLGDELFAAGFTNVRRYQLGTPVWRALVGPMAIEPAGVRYVLDSDRTAAFIDARSPADFASGTLPSARNVPPGDVVKAKDDGRLPMDDFNTRVVVFGRDGTQAHAMAQTLVGQGFNNVKFYDGPFSTLASVLR